MKTKLLIILFGISGILTGNAQCNYIPSTSSSPDTLIYSFISGSFASFGCAAIDPTRWFSGNGDAVTITFVNPQSYPTFRIWGMNDDDSASVSVNDLSYPLTSNSASYDLKVLCGESPGPDGVIFSNGNLTGANSNQLGNYSYQNVQLNTTNVTSLTISSISGAGWGFAGVSVNCPLFTDIEEEIKEIKEVKIYPMPFNSTATIKFNTLLLNAELDIYSLTGLKIRTIPMISGKSLHIQRGQLKSGIYLISLSQKGEIIFADKIVVID